MGKASSRYEALIEVKKDIIARHEDAQDDIVKQKQLEAKINHIDEELAQIIAEIKNEKNDPENIKKQAKTELEARRKANERRMREEVEEAEDFVKSIEAELEKAKRKLVVTEEIAKEELERDNLQAEQEYENILSNAGNMAQTTELKIKKATHEANKRKKELEIELSSIKIKNEAQEKNFKELNTLYNDLKEISAKVSESK